MTVRVVAAEGRVGELARGTKNFEATGNGDSAILDDIVSAYYLAFFERLPRASLRRSPRHWIARYSPDWSSASPTRAPTMAFA